MNNRSFAWLLALMLLIGIGALVLPQTGLFDRPIGRQGNGVDVLAQNNSDQANPNKVTAPTLSEALGVAEEDLVEVGGIKRPKRDLDFANDGTGMDSEDGKKEPSQPDEFTKSLFPNPGSAPAVPIDANPQVAELYATLSKPDAPLAARSALFEPEPFDLEKYKEDPEAWLNQIRPGRAYQAAQPGEGVARIKTNSPIFQNVLQGEKVNLEVQVTSGMPVTFYTPQVGEFSNRLTTHSVAADEKGIARTVYLAGPGTLGVISIMAASPVHSGLLRYKVRVSLPE